MPLHLSSTLQLPDSFATDACAILARRSAGKTYTGSVLAEEMFLQGFPFVVIDPLGVWWGLRSSASGTEPGHKVTILGGGHGDLPLESTAGRVVADFVVDTRASVILDLSHFETGAEQDRFVYDFVDRLYRRKAKHPDPLHVFVDEADSFAPQSPQPNQNRMLGAMISLVRRGRVRGLGCTLITQRAASLSKQVLTQVEVLVLMQITGPHDRKAVLEWVKGNATDEEWKEVQSSLASLQQGEAWVWSPVLLGGISRIKVRKRTTYDSSKTPEPGRSRPQPRASAEVNLDTLKGLMAETVARMENTDPKKLQAHVHELQGKLREVATDNDRLRAELRTATEQSVRDRVGIPAGTIEWVMERTAKLREGMEDHYKLLDTILVEIDDHMTFWSEQNPPDVFVPTHPMKLIDNPDIIAMGQADGLYPPAQPAPSVTTEREDGLKPMEMAILTVLAQYGPKTRRQIGAISGKSYKGGAFSDAMSFLNQKGYIEKGSPVAITTAGREALGSGFVPLPTGSALIDHWLGKLDAMGAGILKFLIDHPEGAYGSTEIAEGIGRSAKGGAFSDARALLNNMDLIHSPGRGMWRLHPDFKEAIGR